MLKQYVQLVKYTFGNYLCNHVMRFLEENVFPHESKMCFYLQKELPIYDASMTTPQEGHHNGIKKSPIGPKHHHSLVRSTKQLVAFSLFSAINYPKKNTQQLHTTSQWSRSPTSKYVTSFIE